MDEVVAKLLSTTDAQVWAQEFMKVYDDLVIVIDEGLMIGWFANAIEVGRAAGASEKQSGWTIRVDGDPPEDEVEQVAELGGAVGRTAGVACRGGHHDLCTADGCMCRCHE